MPVTIQSFVVEHGDPNTVAKLEQALAYLQRSPAATAILELAAANGTRIGLNPFGADNYAAVANPGSTMYDHESRTAVWNPDSALQIKEANGTIIGVQSAALGLLHEMVHAIDPAVMTNMEVRLPGYFRLSEYTAIQYENLVAREIGEVERSNWAGKTLISDNPTTHTMWTENRELVWPQVNQYTKADEYGPLYSSPGRQPELECPGFGSTDQSLGGIEPYENDPGKSGGTDIGGNMSEPSPSEHDNDPVDPGDGGWDGGSDPYDGGFESGNPGDTSGDGGCVATTSFLPDGRLAGDVKVGDTMQLGDQETMDVSEGVVRYSQLREAQCYRITTESGASLICSDTAPIPAKGKGLLMPGKLLGEQVAVRRDEGVTSACQWETVIKVDEVGIIKVQHITVGDKCFWAGEKKGAYILHHNLKQAGDEGIWPEEWDPLTAGPKTDQARAASYPESAEPAQFVGIPPQPSIDGMGFLY